MPDNFYTMGNSWDPSFGGGFGGMGGYSGVDLSTNSSVLGSIVDVSPALQPVIQFVMSAANNGASFGAKKYIVKHGQGIAAKLFDSVAHQENAVGIAANIAEKSLIFYDPLIGTGLTIRNLHKENAGIARNLGSYLEAHGHHPGDFGLRRAARHNEVLADALAANGDQSRNKLAAIAVSTVTAVPTVVLNTRYMAMEEEQRALQQKMHEFENVDLRSPEVISDLKRRGEAMIVKGELSHFAHGGNEPINAAKLLRDHEEDALKNEERALSKAHQEQNNSLNKFQYMYLPGISATASAITQPMLEKGQKGGNKGAVLSMIGHLADQVKSDPSADTIEMNEGQAPVKLADFVREIFVMHQKVRHEPGISKHNMAALDDACDEIAEEIKARRLDPRALIDLVGERQIVHRGGKTLAGHKEISHLIADSEKMLPVQAVDLHQYENDSILSNDEKKAILGRLKGENRALFIVSSPAEQMEKFGVKMQEIQQAHAATAETYDHSMGLAALFITQASDRALHDEGYDNADIKLLRDGVTVLKEQGSKAFGERLGHPGDSDGLVDLIAGNQRLWKNLDKALQIPPPKLRIAANDQHYLGTQQPAIGSLRH